jgi:hypothetical protein
MQRPPEMKLESMIAAVMEDDAKRMPTVAKPTQLNLYQ